MFMPHCFCHVHRAKPLKKDLPFLEVLIGMLSPGQALIKNIKDLRDPQGRLPAFEVEFFDQGVQFLYKGPCQILSPGFQTQFGHQEPIAIS